MPDFQYRVKNGFKYQVQAGRNEVCIVQYIGNGIDVLIPLMIEGKPVTSIGKYAFRNNPRLQSVVVPMHVSQIGSSPFKGCINLRNIFLANPETRICRTEFSNRNTRITVKPGATPPPPTFDPIVEGFDYVFLSGGIRITNYRGNNVNLIIPSRIEGAPVTEIGDEAFELFRSLTSVTFPGTLRRIGRKAFKNCSGLTEITIPSSVHAVEEEAFADCIRLHRVIVQGEATTIHYGAFRNHGRDFRLIKPQDQRPAAKFRYTSTGVFVRIDKYIGNQTVVDIPTEIDGLPVILIGNRAFMDCKTLKRINIPPSVLNIGHNAFTNCSNLETIEIPDSVISIGLQAFKGCKNLTHVKLSNSLWSLSNSIFCDCSSLASIDIPNSVGEIGTLAFWGCKNLLRVNIPDSVVNINDKAFGKCRSLESVTIPSSVNRIQDKVFYGCSNLSHVELPNTVKYINDKAFAYCRSLEYINVPRQLECIFNESFYACKSLRGMLLPNTMTYIGDGAFAFCDNLIMVRYPASVLYLGANAFYGCPDLQIRTVGAHDNNRSRRQDARAGSDSSADQAFGDELLGTAIRFGANGGIDTLIWIKDVVGGLV